MIKFLRRDSKRYSKLGKKRRKKQVWRKPKGRDNKIGGKRKGYPAAVSIGYGKKKELRGRIENKKPFFVRNIKDLEKVNENNIILLGKIGKKRKIEIIKKARERKIPIFKMNLDKSLKKLEKNKIKKVEDKTSKKKSVENES
jgi:large subunit ribosomal protein L32e